MPRGILWSLVKARAKMPGSPARAQAISHGVDLTLVDPGEPAAALL